MSAPAFFHFLAKGVTDLLRELPSENVKTNARFGFSELPVVGSFLANINIGGLVFLRAYQYKEAYNSGKYLPGAREFQRLVITMNLLHKWKYILVFDGIPIQGRSRCNQSWERM